MTERGTEKVSEGINTSVGKYVTFTGQTTTIKCTRQQNTKFSKASIV